MFSCLLGLGSPLGGNGLIFRFSKHFFRCLCPNSSFKSISEGSCPDAKANAEAVAIIPHVSLMYVLNLSVMVFVFVFIMLHIFLHLLLNYQHYHKPQLFLLHILM